KPVDGSGGKGIVIGPAASAQELEDLRRTVLMDPRGWIAQPVLQLSTVPTLAEDQFGPRHVDLRPFAVNDGEDVWVLPGGLTRVALEEGSLIVNSSQGGGSKDTWVIRDSAPTTGDDDAPEVRVVDTDATDSGEHRPVDGVGNLEEFREHHDVPQDVQASRQRPGRSQQQQQQQQRNVRAETCNAASVTPRAQEASC
ncbi:MAG: circularly permuted type 2 ATP-grasp protein, partial [Micrococcus sp.]|nr:circularly permuted type 2 ATP-grasp protein [Micrococcus sp.]